MSETKITVLVPPESLAEVRKEIQTWMDDHDVPLSNVALEALIERMAAYAVGLIVHLTFAMAGRDVRTRTVTGDELRDAIQP